MLRTYVIATMLEVSSKWDEISKQIMREDFVVGTIIADGPGCENLGLCIDIETDEEAEHYLNTLTMSLMPARWTNTCDTPWLGIENLIGDDDGRV